MSVMPEQQDLLHPDSLGRGRSPPWALREKGEERGGEVGGGEEKRGDGEGGEVGEGKEWEAGKEGTEFTPSHFTTKSISKI